MIQSAQKFTFCINYYQYLLYTKKPYYNIHLVSDLRCFSYKYVKITILALYMQ